MMPGLKNYLLLEITLLLLVLNTFCACNKLNSQVEIPLLLYKADSEPVKVSDDTLEDGSDDINIILTGDTMLSRNVEHLCREKSDYDYPFSQISYLIKKTDIAFTNLETPLVDGENLKTGLTFRADPRFAAALRRAGLNIVSVANNHILDRGVAGLAKTLLYLEKSGVAYSGADRKSLSGKGVIISAGSCRVGFISLTDTLNSLRRSDYARDKVINYNNTEGIINAVRDLRRKSDVVIVSVHWGMEMASEPSEREIELAKKIISAGADIIAGHHPHVIQPYRKINGGHVFFSMGNFVFDQTAKSETRSAVMIGVTVRNKKIHSIVAYPLAIDREYRPGLCSEGDAGEVYKKLLL